MFLSDNVSEQSTSVVNKKKYWFVLTSNKFFPLELHTLKEKKVEGKLTFVQKTGSAWSKWWNNFEEIFDGETKEEFVRCKSCQGYEYKPGSNTNSIIRHKCENLQSGRTKIIRIAPEMKEQLKMGSACFVAKDLRPYKAVECVGLLDLCNACMKFGQKYRNAKREDLEDAMPSRNTVRNTVSEIAQSNRNKIKPILREAIETGGIAATVDCWQDDYCKRHYICVVAHLTTQVGTKQINRYRFVLSTKEIPELSKTGE